MLNTAGRFIGNRNNLFSGYGRNKIEKISEFSRPVAVVEDLDADHMTDLTRAKRAVIEQFVKKMGGKRTIQRILIANNGMAATKSILSMRQWAYMVLGDERAIEFVALATRDDLNANAEFIRLEDTYVEVPSGSNKARKYNQNIYLELIQ